MDNPKKKTKKPFVVDSIIWDNFERFRAEKGWSYAKAARQMKVSPAHLATIKASKLGVGAETLAKMAKTFGKAEEEFLNLSFSRLIVLEDVVAVYPRAGLIVKMLLDVVKMNPTAEHFLRYSIDLLKSELAREMMRLEEIRRKKDGASVDPDVEQRILSSE